MSTRNTTTDHQHDPLRKIAANGNIQIPSTSRSLFRCAYCDKYHRHYKLKRCKKCRSAVYCNATCQAHDWKENNHRARCENIAVHQQNVTELAHEYQHGSAIDVFDRAYGFIGTFCAHGPNGIGSMGRQYCQYRMDLAEAVMDEAVARLAPPLKKQTKKKSATNADNNNNSINSNDNQHYPHYNRLALELALEHCLDLLHLDNLDHPSLARTWVCHIYFVLERYQDLYDYVKFWCYTPPKLREIRRHSMFSEQMDRMLEPDYFLNMSKQNLLENQAELILRYPSPQPRRVVQTLPGPTKSEVVNVLYMALAKLMIYQIIKGVKLVESGLVASRIASFLGVDDEWMAIADPESILRQCRELLCYADDCIPNFLAFLIYQPSLPTPEDPHHAWVKPIQWLKTAWASHPFAWQFLGDYLKNKNTLKALVSVPRDDFMQTVLNEAFRQFIDEKILAPPYLRGVEHFQKNRTSDAVRQLLCEKMTNSSHLLDVDSERFCATPILMALQDQGEDTEENLELLFGDVAFPAVGIEVDRFLAAETMEHGRYNPLLCNFRLRHEVTISPLLYEEEGEEDATSVIEFFDIMDEAYMELTPHSPYVISAVKLLIEKDLATDENLSLFFGDGGRVADLTSYWTV